MHHQWQQVDAGVKPNLIVRLNWLARITCTFNDRAFRLRHAAIGGDQQAQRNWRDGDEREDANP
jgi:hypothetical protein